MTVDARIAAVHESFARQGLMRTLGAELRRVAAGAVTIAMPASDGVCQQHGFAHAGAVAAIADSACGYACLTQMSPGTAVLTVEFKINLLAPADGRSFEARARTLRVGRTIGVAVAEVFALDAVGAETCVAIMQATMMALESRTGRVG